MEQSNAFMVLMQKMGKDAYHFEGGLVEVKEPHLFIRDEHLLTSLPDKLRLWGGLSLIRCHNIVGLPSGLIVPGILEIDTCMSLSQIPSTVRALSRIMIRNCTALTCISEEILPPGGIQMATGPEEDDFEVVHPRDFNRTTRAYSSNAHKATEAVLELDNYHWKSVLARAILGSHAGG